MRKIVITIISSVIMLAMAYLPFVSSFHSPQINVAPGVVHAQTAEKMYCYYWTKNGETTQHEECAFSQQGCEMTQDSKTEEYGASNITINAACAYVVPKSDIYNQPRATTSNLQNPSSQTSSGNTTVAQDTNTTSTSNSTLGDECTQDSTCGAGMYCSQNVGDEIGHCATGTRPATNGGTVTTDNGGTVTTSNGGSGTASNGGSGTASNGGSGTVISDKCPPTQLCNPLKYDTLCDLLNGLLTLVTQIGAMIAVLLIIWTGFKFITAQGNPKKLTDAKNAFITTLIGTAVLLGASAIAQITIKTVLTITNQNNPGICHI